MIYDFIGVTTDKQKVLMQVIDHAWCLLYGFYCCMYIYFWTSIKNKHLFLYMMALFHFVNFHKYKQIAATWVNPFMSTLINTNFKLLINHHIYYLISWIRTIVKLDLPFSMILHYLIWSKKNVSTSVTFMSFYKPRSLKKSK